MNSVSVIIRALLLALGATEDEVEPAMHVLRPQQVPPTPAAALAQARAALATIRAQACTCTYVEPDEACPLHGRAACDAR